MDASQESRAVLDEIRVASLETWLLSLPHQSTMSKWLHRKVFENGFSNYSPMRIEKFVQITFNICNNSK